ncbi:MAG: TIGR02449 family protein [Thiopseudomonas sp.]
MKKPDFAALAGKIQQLVQRHAELKAQYAALKEAEQRWLEERAQLISKNETARHKVEVMISRLKALEQES